jgi:Arc/MetJ-type ribon-helix-helix transcriptional regulator
MKFPNKRTKLTTFSLTPADDQMIIELLESGNFLSRSEVIRHCIRTAHKKQFPYYVELGKKKDEAEAIKNKLQSLPNEEYCTEVLHGELKIKPGFCYFKHNNPEKPVTLDIPLDSVKNFASRDDVWKMAGISPEDE